MNAQAEVDGAAALAWQRRLRERRSQGRRASWASTSATSGWACTPVDAVGVTGNREGSDRAGRTSWRLSLAGFIEGYRCASVCCGALRLSRSSETAVPGCFDAAFWNGAVVLDRPGLIFVAEAGRSPPCCPSSSRPERRRPSPRPGVPAQAMRSTPEEWARRWVSGIWYAMVIRNRSRTVQEC